MAARTLAPGNRCVAEVHVESAIAVACSQAELLGIDRLQRRVIGSVRQVTGFAVPLRKRDVPVSHSRTLFHHVFVARRTKVVAPQQAVEIRAVRIVACATSVFGEWRVLVGLHLLFAYISMTLLTKLAFRSDQLVSEVGPVKAMAQRTLAVGEWLMGLPGRPLLRFLRMATQTRVPGGCAKRRIASGGPRPEMAILAAHASGLGSPGKVEVFPCGLKRHFTSR